MVTNKNAELEAFASRLNEALDGIGYPIKGRGRQLQLGRDMQVSQKAAAKWLEGETFPTQDKTMTLARMTGCRYEWLMMGHEPKYPDAPPAPNGGKEIPPPYTPDEIIIIRNYRAASEAGKQTIKEISDTLASLSPAKDQSAFC